MSKRRPWIRHSVTIFIIGLLSWVGSSVMQRGKVTIAPIPDSPAPPGYYPVVHVTDGDTITVQIAGQNQIVRLLGIDTPETHDPRKPVQCYGEAAAATTRQLLAGKAVRLVGDPEDSNQDKYHRLLRYVYLPDGTMINRYLVEHGYAFAYTIFALTKLQDFKDWQHTAQAAGRGLWSACQIHLDGRIEQTQAVGPSPQFATPP